MTPKEVPDASTEDLIAERTQLEVDLARIKGQLSEASARARASGEYADSGWYNAAQCAVRMKGVMHQSVLRELGARKKQAARTHNDRLLQGFFEAARRRLAPETFQDLLSEAQDARMDAEALVKA